jgi:DhnA family fructose-bisphosphate aldolase class Ia
MSLAAASALGFRGRSRGERASKWNRVFQRCRRVGMSTVGWVTTYRRDIILATNAGCHGGVLPEMLNCAPPTRDGGAPG